MIFFIDCSIIETQFSLPNFNEDTFYINTSGENPVLVIFTFHLNKSSVMFATNILNFTYGRQKPADYSPTRLVCAR